MEPINDDTNVPLTLKQGLDAFSAVYMPARNYSPRTREEYQRDLQALVDHLESRKLTSWLIVGLRDLQWSMAELDRRGLEPSSRNRKTYAIKTSFAYLAQAGYLKQDPAKPHMIKRRARQAGLPHTTCCHTFRATGITTYLQNGGTIEHAQQIAKHPLKRTFGESPCTTKLHDRTNDAVSLDEIERILIQYGNATGLAHISD